MSDQNQKINLEPLSDEFISEHSIELFDLWMIKSENEMLGPFDTETLRKYSQENHELFNEYFAFNMATEKWTPFFKVTQFQRRKPKLVPMQSLKTVDEFYILQKGIKKGPYTLVQIKNLVDQKQIPLNIQASIDKGESWIKLFEHHEFDRRLLKNKEELPYSPDQAVFNHHTHQMQVSMLKNKKIQDEQDAMIGLAFIGQGNDKGQKILFHPEHTEHQEASSSIEAHESFMERIINKLNLRYGAYAIAGVFVFFTVLNSFNSSYDGETTNLQTETKQPNEMIQRRKPASVDNKAPTKIIEAKKYKPVQRNERIERDEKETRKPRRYKQVHTDERYETIDIDDPYVKEELTRELAGEYGNDELTPQEIEFIEKADQDGLSQEEQQKLDEYERERYQEVQDFD